MPDKAKDDMHLAPASFAVRALPALRRAVGSTCTRCAAVIDGRQWGGGAPRTLTAAATAAPALMPVSRPSSLARRRAIAMDSSDDTCMHTWYHANLFFAN